MPYSLTILLPGDNWNEALRSRALIEEALWNEEIECAIGDLSEVVSIEEVMRRINEQES